MTDAIDTLAEDAVGLRVLYLADARGGGRWLAEWSRSSSLPSAIGIARSAHGDTLLVRIGTRG